MLILEGHLRKLRNSLSFPNSRHLEEVSVSRLRPLKSSLGTASQKGCCTSEVKGNIILLDFCPNDHDAL